MLAQRFLSFFLALLTLVAVAAATASPFLCTGGSIYFTANTADSLLYHNPDLLHDLYVFKCVTTVVFTADSGGDAANHTTVLEHERGLEEAYKFMNDASYRLAKTTRDNSDSEQSAHPESGKEELVRTETMIKVGKHNITASSLGGMPNAQILYLRLPASTQTGQGYEAFGNETLKRLYKKQIPHITTTDGTAMYTLDDMKDVISTILRDRKANTLRVLNHLASLLADDDDDVEVEHPDRIVSAKLVVDVVKEEQIKGSIQAYASDFMRKLDANLNTADFNDKAATYFEYAKRAPDRCQSLKECADRLKDAQAASHPYDEQDYISRFLKREYYAS
ncbi:hypothetical protein BDW02DRAFT_430119 [Decorospora gaudefroyi]|uniref:Uncharacterized protein n=1 Tax=Decorospora gaudefroyi TaxID=184978 RepID=A0A6A5K677_9PLEO|nr:hypothetical protein BDW02DRAFT_430119 [Decorospora gaudefroyi]